MEPTDTELLELIRADDLQGRKAFALRHLKWAAVYASRKGAGDQADDVAQNVLISVIQRPPSELRHESARPYMKTAIKREIRRVQGRAPLTLITGGSCLVDMPHDGTSPTAVVARLEVLRPTLKAIADLPTPQREVVVLRHGKGLTFPEIAAVTGRRESSERITHRRVLERLRRKLSGYFLKRNGS